MTRPHQSHSKMPAGYDAEEINFGAVLTTLWHGRRLMGLVVLSITLMATLYVIAIATPVYTATSVVILKPNQTRIIDLHSVTSGMTGDTTEVNSELEVLRSHSLLEKVSARLNLIDDPEFNSELHARQWFSSLQPENTTETTAHHAQNRVTSALSSAITVRNVRASLVFRITASSQDPVKAAVIADAVAETYVAEQLRVKTEASQQAILWLENRVDELRQTLQDAETQVALFTAQTDLVSPESLRQLERQAKDLRERIATMTGAKLTLTKDLADIQKTQAVSVPLNQKQRNLSRVEQQLSSLLSSEKELSLQIAAQSRDLITLQQLSREAEAAQVLYEYFLTRFNETSAQQGIQQADSRILSRAVIPLHPSEPRKLRILVLAFMTSLALGTVLVLLRDKLRNLQDVHRQNALTRGP